MCDVIIQNPVINSQEKIHPQALVENLRDTAKPGEVEPELQLFADFNGITDFDKKVDFYHHEGHWSNRMILGDSLLVSALRGPRDRRSSSRGPGLESPGCSKWPRMPTLLRDPSSVQHLGRVSSRREFLSTLGGAALAAGGLRRGAPARGSLGPLGVQLYTLRREMQRDFEGTLARVAEIGYREVEFAGYFDRAPEQVRAALDRTGLVGPGAHVPVELLSEGWARALDAAHVIGHEWLIVAWIPQELRRTLDDWRRLAERFNRAGEEAARAGLRFAIHNHTYEFDRIGDRLPYDELLEACDPRVVDFEMDLFWIAKGGGDPVAYFARYPGRFPMVHVKDMDARQQMVDVGAGVIDWRRIFADRRQAGIRHYFVEHDEPPDPLASVRASYAYLSRLSV